MGESTLGLKDGRLLSEVASDAWRSSAAREVTKPTGGRWLGGGAFEAGVVDSEG